MRKITDYRPIKLRKDQEIYNVKKANKAMSNNTELIAKGMLPVIHNALFAHADIAITDKRDIKEFNRRMRKQTCNPLRDELYSINPNFNGIYSDPQNR